MTQAMHPKAPALAVHVGITGHRDLSHPWELSVVEARIGEILEVIRQLVHKRFERDGEREGRRYYADALPVLRFVSVLHEGADRLAAHVATRQGYQVQCVVPFTQVDLLGPAAVVAARSQLRSVLEAPGTTVLELVGGQEHEDQARMSASRLMLAHLDVLIAVWDGIPRTKKGRVDDVVVEACDHDILVLRVAKDVSHPIEIYWRDKPGDPAWQDGLDLHLRNLLQPPKSPVDEPNWWQPAYWIPRPLRDLDGFLTEYPRRYELGAVFSLVRKALGSVGVRWPRVLVKSYDESARANLQESVVREALPFAASIDEAFWPHYVWADKLADYFAGWYRISFLLRYILAVAAVVTVAWAGDFALWFQVAVNVAIVATFLIANVRYWHERWVDYRLLAELIRQSRLLAHLGRALSLARLPAHQRHSEAGWVKWYIRGIVRAHGIIPTGIMKFDDLRTYAEYLRAFLAGQADYHTGNSNTCLKAAARLKRWSQRLFLVSLGVALFRLSPLATYMVWHGHDLLKFLATILPALAAAMSGFNSQAEFKRIGQRSGAMCAILSELRERAEALKAADNLTLGRLNSVVDEAASVMVNEPLDWRVVVLAKSLNFS
ncbi:MAG TPA: hypothetical protein VD902_00130 [Symbiobacteriaceae bacterium]|nr:hypothetical protein [Symbiobacteriaceae bacterium]